MNKKGNLDFAYLSVPEIQKNLAQVKSSNVPISQKFYLIKHFLINVQEPEIVLEEIPNIIICSSGDFVELYETFNMLIVQNPLCVSKLLQILGEFDYDKNAKLLAYELALSIFDNIEKDKIQDLVPFLLFAASKQMIPSLYNRLKEILLMTETSLIYQAFEKGVRPHLSLFFHYLLNNVDEKWTFFDFYVLLISQSKPSLRKLIPSFIAQSIICQRLTFDLINSFCDHIGILESRFELLILFYNNLLLCFPKCYETSIISPLSQLAIHIINCYPGLSSPFVDDILNHVIHGTLFLAEISSHCLLSIPSKYFSHHISELDDLLIQKSNILTPIALHTICKLISMNGSDQNNGGFTQNSSVMISIQKKLFSTSSAFVELGINMALHFSQLPNFDEIVKWVLKAVHVDKLIKSSLRPNALLSVIDLLWLKFENYDDDDMEIINEIVSFCIEVVNAFSLIKKLDDDDSVIGSAKLQYGISSSHIPTELHATLCGECIFLLSFLLNKDALFDFSKKHAKGKDNYYYPSDDPSIRIEKDQLQSLKNLTSLSFVVPEEFIKINVKSNEKVKLKTIQMMQIAHSRQMIIPIIYRHKDTEINTVMYYVDIINTIDEFFSSPQMLEIRYQPKSTFDNTFFPASFVFSILENCFFEFPNDLNFVYLLLKSLYSLFADSMPSRFSLVDKISFLKNRIQFGFPTRILTIVESMTNMSVLWRKENKIKQVKRCVRAASYGLDFVTFCIACGIDVDIDFKVSIIGILEINEDTGIACRLIQIGAFLGVNITDLAQLASKALISHHLTSDLCQTHYIYPFGFAQLNEIVKPFNNGESWRLIIFISLQFTEFEQFFNQFNIVLDEIRTGRIEIQMTLVLAEILISKIHVFSQNFNEMSSICSKLVVLMTHSDLSILRLIFKMLNEFNNAKLHLIQISDNSYDFDTTELNNLTKHFKRQVEQFPNVEKRPAMKNIIAKIFGVCEMLTNAPHKTREEDDVNHELIPKENIQPNPFDIESESDKDFVAQTSTSSNSSSESDSDSF